jgi:plasmid maintenance system killer protein
LEIGFRTAKLKKESDDFKLLRKAHGEHRAKLIRRRLDAIVAAAVLEDLRNAPGRLHELTKNRQGQLSLDLDGPYRLILVPAHNPIPVRAGGGMDWSQITAVTVLGIEDTHE